MHNSIAKQAPYDLLSLKTRSLPNYGISVVVDLIGVVYMAKIGECTGGLTQ